MERNTTQQEILLMTGSAFFQQQCYEKNEQDKDSNKNMSQREKLEEACWNGLLPEILPEIFAETNAQKKKLYLWQVKEGASFLELELGEYPEEKDSYFSIDPYSFLAFRCSN